MTKLELLKEVSLFLKDFNNDDSLYISRRSEGITIKRDVLYLTKHEELCPTCGKRK